MKWGIRSFLIIVGGPPQTLQPTTKIIRSHTSECFFRSERMFEMSKPIYKVWLGKYTEAWYELSPEEQQKYSEGSVQALAEAGGEAVITCMSVWSSENYLGWGVEKFPDIEAAQKHADLLWEMNHYKYIESTSYLGTEIPRS